MRETIKQIKRAHRLDIRKRQARYEQEIAKHVRLFWQMWGELNRVNDQRRAAEAQLQTPDRPPLSSWETICTAGQLPH